MTGFYHTIMNFLSLVLIFIERSRYSTSTNGAAVIDLGGGDGGGGSPHNHDATYMV